MKVIISSEQMKRLDSKTIDEFGIPSRVLMENAGKGFADFLKICFDDELVKGVVVLCGYGNNGGDGYVIARWLNHYNYNVTIITVGNGNSSPETTINRDLCKKLSIEFIDSQNEDFKVVSEAVLFDSGVIIDAIYGIGFKGRINEETKDLLEFINGINTLKVSVDIPSGVNADTGFADIAFMADLTLTMEALKYGHLLGAGKKYSGYLETIPIGIPASLWNDEEVAVLIDASVEQLPERKVISHKGNYGRIAVFAGSPGYTGAAFLASYAAVKAGAGLVTIFCHPEQRSVFDNKPYEVMVRDIPIDAEQKIDTAALNKALERFDVILYGPGCTTSDLSLQFLLFILNNWNKSAVIDADGLNTLSLHKELYPLLAQKPIILTPHWGEFCRLADLNMDDMHKDCLTPLKKFVQENKVKVLLKSDTSIYYDNEIMYFNTTGNDGLSTGGSGDVLSGIIAGFLAQKMSPANAAGMAAYYLGLTAELMAEKQETLSITPTEILDCIFKFEVNSETAYNEE